jgi:hypothetical protein
VAKNILHMLSSLRHMSPFDGHIVRECHTRRNHPIGSGRHVFAFPARRGSYMRFLRRK